MSRWATPGQVDPGETPTLGTFGRKLNFITAGSRWFTIPAEGKPVTADLDLAKAPGIRAPWTLEVQRGVDAAQPKEQILMTRTAR